MRVSKRFRLSSYEGESFSSSEDSPPPVGPPPIPPPPASYNVMGFDAITFTASAQVSTRQLAFEPSVAGVDHGFSLSVWIMPHNCCLPNLTTRCFGVMEPGTAVQQWSLQIVPVSNATFNQCWQFTIANTGTSINILTNKRAKRGVWHHIVITYDGSETQAGLKFYLNGVLETDVTKTQGGTYAGAYNAAALRMCLSVPSAGAGKFSGRQRDLAVWTSELSAAEVLALYNSDIPVDVQTLSFYAGKIGGYWPLRVDVSCLNNVSFNFGGVVGINTTSYPISVSYPYLATFNAIPGNTRYVSFGSVYQVSDYAWASYQRSGVDHTTFGKVVRLNIDTSGYTPIVSAPVDVINLGGSNDIRSAQAAEIAGSVYLFSSWQVGGVFQDLGYWKSTDGLTGLAFGSIVSLASLIPSVASITFNSVQALSGGRFMISVYGSTGGTVYWGGYFIRDAAGVFTYKEIWTSATHYNETAILDCGGGKWISVVRREAGGIFFTSSIDDGVTWSALVNTNVVGGAWASVPGLTLSATGKVILWLGDRVSGVMKVSSGNLVATLIASPTTWSTLGNFWSKYSFNPPFILGYPTGKVWGSMGLVAYSDEFSLTRADLFFGYGQMEY